MIHFVSQGDGFMNMLVRAAAAWVVGALALTAAGQTAPAIKPAATKDAAAKDAPLTAPELEAKLKATAASGKYADTLPGQFLQYADLAAREKLVPSAVSEKFWAWLAGHKVLHKAVLVNLHPKYDPAMVKLLADLHEKFPADVDKFPHLALAFALNGAAAGKRPITAGWAQPSRHQRHSAAPGIVPVLRHQRQADALSARQAAVAAPGLRGRQRPLA